ncbi:MAG: 2-amino-4-hydroxy-6-hydroxymethyldihydropteridine diphosphokinase [Gammaproteobacteria bacterium]|nr:2-amino-4-hydroxy-6-hydroxymethyldihydropteridine diphosphokinase [Gammaproteobacteria bacterium]
MVRVVLGIGSNVDRRRHVQAAVDALRARFGEVLLSPVYRSRARGFDGPDFYNLAALIDTDLPVDELHRELRAIEDDEGRTRNGARFASRTLDIDILLYGDAVLRDDGYNVPRDEILTCAFVLKPLADLVPATVHPETGNTLAEEWCRFGPGDDDSALRREDWSPA